MKKSNIIINIISLIAIVAAVVFGLYQVCLVKGDHTTMLIICGIIILAGLALMVWNNFSYNAYGGRFAARYPDSDPDQTRKQS